MAEAKRSTGSVKWFNGLKEILFIYPDDGSENRSLAEGEHVEFMVDKGVDGKTKAGVGMGLVGDLVDLGVVATSVGRLDTWRRIATKEAVEAAAEEKRVVILADRLSIPEIARKVEVVADVASRRIWLGIVPAAMRQRLWCILPGKNADVRKDTKYLRESETEQSTKGLTILVMSKALVTWNIRGAGNRLKRSHGIAALHLFLFQEESIFNM